MGAKRKVDVDLYAKIKRELKTPKDDKKVMTKYGLGQTTVRAIRNSLSYDHFLLKTQKPTKKDKVGLEPLCHRPPLTTADKVVVLFVWIVMLGMGIGALVFIAWLIYKMFGW